jgi:hypothetical protein
MIEWRGLGFDPNSVDDVAIRRRLAALVKRPCRPRQAKRGA